MKIALAGCSGLSSDQPLRRRLGDDYQPSSASPAAPTATTSATRAAETLESTSGLSDEEKQRLLLVVSRAIDQVCTVGRTLKVGHRDHLRDRRPGWRHHG